MKEDKKNKNYVLIQKINIVRKITGMIYGLFIIVFKND
jgi:hypothetical protein